MKTILFLSVLLFSDTQGNIQNHPGVFSVYLENFSDKFYNSSVIKYKVSSASRFLLPDTPFQKTEKNFDNDRINPVFIICGISGKSSLPDGSLLANTPFLNMDDAELQKVSSQFRNSKDKTDSIERFVYDHINKKIFGLPLAAARGIFRNKEGDCTEHTVLAVSLLRLAGVPSRAVVGMIFCGEFMGRKNVFVYHMWAEAYYKNKWILVDATRPGKKYPERYISISYHHLKTAMPLDYLRAVSSMRNFKIEYADKQE